MRWPWQRKPDPPHDEQGFDEAHAALEDAMSAWPEVREVAQQIRDIRRRNHLAEITERALRGNR